MPEGLIPRFQHTAEKTKFLLRLIVGSTRESPALSFWEASGRSAIRPFELLQTGAWVPRCGGFRASS